jgi:TonB family protein
MVFARMAFVFFVLLASALSARAQYPQQKPHFSSEANAVLGPSQHTCAESFVYNEARQAKFNGTMVLRVVVSEEGEVIYLQVLKGLPFDLNQQALHTVRTWKFQPAMMGGQPVSVLVPIEVSFSLY